VSTLLTNWKTTLTGLVALLLNVPVFVTALYAWGKHEPVDWRNVLVTTAITVIGAGLLAAKDSTTHSTAAQVEVSTEKAVAAEVPAPMNLPARAASFLPLEKAPRPILLPEEPKK